MQLILPATAAGFTLYHRDGPGALQFGESAALNLGVTYGLKYTVDEKRPKGGGQSFPSGHTSVSFASAEFLRKRYGWAYGAPAYALASFVGFSRVEPKAHYIHDVLAGAAIGIGSSYLVTEPYEGWGVRMEAEGGRYILNLSRRF